MTRAGPAIAACLAASLAAIGPTRGQEPDPSASISAALHDWASAFNRGDAAGVCALFAPDLIATIRGAPDRGRDQICAQLTRALARPGVHLTYTPDIREVIVAGDLAVVRVVWTLTTTTAAARQVSEEPGQDVFRRQPDGKWRIARFMAFSRDPD